MAPSLLHVSAAAEGLQGDGLLAAELLLPPAWASVTPPCPGPRGPLDPGSGQGPGQGSGASMAHAQGVWAGETAVLAPPSLLLRAGKTWHGCPAGTRRGEPALGSARWSERAGPGGGRPFPPVGRVWHAPSPSHTPRAARGAARQSQQDEQKVTRADLPRGLHTGAGAGSGRCPRRSQSHPFPVEGWARGPRPGPPSTWGSHFTAQTPEPSF